ncbi:MAG TPA: topoisomerase C-terminal repeat-containing protein, partial [Afifellaceae bacterium]|nr:topoisomerase C-terminal repeat-containing protein [Afifellaceae bacterium]
EGGEGEDNRVLPPLKEGERLGLGDVVPEQHFTQPPPRYTEATLVKKMEELGIGRPSTYAQTMSVLRDREYVRMDRKRFVPEDKGRLVIAFLESFFQRYVEYDFTADLEEKLDRISAGELAWKDVLHDFWRDFTGQVDDIKDLRVSQVLDALNEILGEFVFPPRENGTDPRACPSCDDGRLSLKLGKFGAFIGCSNYPECRYTRQLAEADGEPGSAATNGSEGKPLGTDPESGLAVTLRTGRFGPYVQLGDGDKPKRTGLPKGWSPDDIDLEAAFRLLSLPREIGPHPETGKPVTAGIGRYGPFVSHDGQYANLDNVDEVFTVGANRAITLLAEKKSRGGGHNRASVLKELGEHPELGGPITVRDGRYGPYVNHAKINATLPKSQKPEEVTLDQAVALIAEKAAKGGKKKAGGRKKAKAAQPSEG